MDWWLFTFFLGAILSLFLPIVPALFQLFLLLLLIIILLRYKSLRIYSGFALGALWLLANAWFYHYKSQTAFDHIKQVQQLSNKKALDIQGEVITLQNIVALEEAKAEINPAGGESKSVYPKQRFNFRVSHINNIALQFPIDVRLSWKKSSLIVAKGQRLRLKVKLKPSYGLVNLGAFNYHRWLTSKQISATGYVLNNQVKAGHNIELKSGDVLKIKPNIKQDIKQINKQALMLSSTVNAKVDSQFTRGSFSVPKWHLGSSLRQRLFYQYQTLLAHSLSPRDSSLAPLLFALTFGDKSQITPAQWRVLRASGTGHLMAISGLHIGLVATGSFLLVICLVRVLPIRTHRITGVNIRFIALLISVSMAFIYSFLAGFALPTTRALIMLLLYWASRLLGIHLSMKRWLLIALFILIVFTPFSLLTVSFWLSFYAVVCIFFTLWRFRYWLASGNTLVRFIKGLLVIQLMLTLLLLPLSALFFQQVSLVSLLANLVAVPWVSFISIVLSLLSVVMMFISEVVAQQFMLWSLESLDLIWLWLSYLSHQSWAVMALSKLQMYCLVFGVFGFVGGVCFYQPVLSHVMQSKTYRFALCIVLAGVVCTAVFFVVARIAVWPEPKVNKPVPTLWQIVMFDVGQGLAVLIKRGEHAMLYDTGASYPSGFNMADAAILPYLQYMGIKRLDKVFVSHSDNDHAGSLANLLNQIKVTTLISNDRSTQMMQESFEPCLARTPMNWQGLSVQVLWPLASTQPEKLLTQKSIYNKAARGLQKNVRQNNDDSCVLLIFDGYHKVLLTGDISKKVERKILTLYPDLRVDVVTVPHHGSVTSSSEDFISQLSPSIALVSSGYLNRWGMPDEKVVSRYKQHNAKLINTAEVGQVILTLNERSILVESYRENLRPFWPSK